MRRPRRDKDIHSLPKVKGLRSALRKTLTPAEAAFWKLVKGSQFEGRKFVRQHSVGNYILDFYCPSEKLAVELDGKAHFSTAGQLYDLERRAFLESTGILVVRFENRHVFEDTEWVLDMIRSKFRYGPASPANCIRSARVYPHKEIAPLLTKEGWRPERLARDDGVVFT